MTTVVAITGGIGSGKSTFSNEVKKRGFKLIDSDQQVATIYKKPTKNFLKFLMKIGLGDSVKNNKINKKKILNKIFINKSTKLSLENYLFKIVRKERDIFIKKEKRKKTKIVFVDIPLLFENHLTRDFDIVISIISSKKERYKRLKKTKKMKKNLFDKIIKSQTTDLERKNKSDIVLTNNKTMSEYLKKINKTIKLLT